MQGVFENSLSSNYWSAALDPGVDEATQEEVREQQALRRRTQEAAAARAADPAAPPPLVPVVLPPLPVPVVPPLRIHVKKKQFFVVKTMGTDPPREGEDGHYIVVYQVDATTGEAKPFKLSQAVALPAPPPTPSDAPVPAPDMAWCVQGRDFITPSSDDYYEVGMQYLQQVMEEAEETDLAFARRMEGFGNVNPSVVWNCLDPDYDPTDREAVMAQFMSKYMEKFYSRLDGGNIPTIEAVSAEALHKHKAFCKAWAEKHYRTLTPVVTAPAEALAGEFHSMLMKMMPENTKHRRPTRMELARVLMRHDEFAPEFASALHYYMANLEQTRGGRNANYKQIRMMSAARVTSYQSLGAMLSEKRGLLLQVLLDVSSPGDMTYCMHPLTVDWYSILGQAPHVHRYFEDASPYQGLSEARRATAEGRVPPWRFGRAAHD